MSDPLLQIGRTEAIRTNYQPDYRIGPKEVFGFLHRYMLLIVLGIAVCFALGFLYVSNAQQTYTATTTILVEGRRGGWNGPGAEASIAQFNLDSSQIESQIQVLKSAQIINPVIQGLGLDGADELGGQKISFFTRLRNRVLGGVAAPDPSLNDDGIVLSDRLQVRRIGQSYVLEISYWSRDALLAARICNSLTASYIADRLQNKIDAAESGSEIIEQRITRIREQLTIAKEVIKTGTFTSSSFPSSDARVITPAVAPARPSWPKKSLTLALASVVGLFGALMIAAVHRSVDASIRTRRHVESSLGLLFLGSLPAVSFSRGRLLWKEVIDFPASLFSKSFLYSASLARLRCSEMENCLGVVSVFDGEGKSTVSSNLAIALAESGSRVLLIDADLNRRHLSRLYTSRAPGVNHFTHGNLPQGSGADQDIITRSNICATLDFLSLTRGEADIDRRVLALEAKIRHAISFSTKNYDFVVVDFPSLSSTPSLFLCCADLMSCLFVFRYGKVDENSARHYIDLLSQSKVRLAGAIVNMARR